MTADSTPAMPDGPTPARARWTPVFFRCDGAYSCLHRIYLLPVVSQEPAQAADLFAWAERPARLGVDHIQPSYARMVLP